MSNARWAGIVAISAAAFLSGCRTDTTNNVELGTGQFGAAGSGYTAQCSGWFPDWISQVPPASTQTDFQMSQGYYLGVPIFNTSGTTVTLDHYDRPQDAVVAQAPWLAYDFHIQAQRMNYLNALLQYVLQDNATSGFNIGPTSFSWFNVPMMTTDVTTRREPLHGLTRERTLFPSDWSWITNSSTGLRSYAIGYYNLLGSYTVGRVFKDVNPALADPAKASFVNGTLVFKILFSEYDSTKINTGAYPLDGAPEWTIQDVTAPTHTIQVRLIQMDIAVKDPRSITGWVFATYVYDKSLTATNAWTRLTPVGLMWGDDPTVPVSSSTITEGWLNSGAAALSKPGVNGRLVGPVDNTKSSCISCHSTAQIDQGLTHAGGAVAGAFTGAVTIPPSGCTAAQRASWFRDLPSGTPFGVTDSSGAGCNLAATPTGTTLRSLDNSLQLQVGLESSLYYANPNPCIGKTPNQVEAPQSDTVYSGERRATRPSDFPRRVAPVERQRLQLTPELGKRLITDEKLPKR